MKTLALLLLLIIVPAFSSKAQVLRSVDQAQAEDPHASDEIIRQILDLNFLFHGQEDLPYSTEPSPFGGALLPDPSYDPNYRVPEHLRIYPPGYLERKKQTPEAVR